MNTFVVITMLPASFGSNEKTDYTHNSYITLHTIVVLQIVLNLN